VNQHSFSHQFCASGKKNIYMSLLAVEENNHNTNMQKMLLPVSCSI